jgi:hypothetical protein
MADPSDFFLPVTVFVSWGVEEPSGVGDGIVVVGYGADWPQPISVSIKDNGLLFFIRES